MENKSSTLKEELEEIDQHTNNLKDNIELGQMLTDLHDDERFKRVILDGYLEKEAQRLFGMLVTPSNLKRDSMENMMDKLGSIRNMKEYFRTVFVNAAMAKEELPSEIEYRKEVTERHANNVDAVSSGSEE